MPTQTLTVSYSKTSSSNYAYSNTIHMPEATAINSVTASPTVQNGIQYSFNAETKMLSITASLPYTRYQAGTTKQVPLSSSYVSNGRLYCVWPDGTSSSPYTGQSCPSSKTVTDEPARYHYEYTITVNYSGNRTPSITLSTTNARTLYENDTINVGGTVQDADAGNVMMVKYQINSGTTRTIHTSVSDGSAMPFNRVLTFRGNKLYDGNNAVTADLQQGAQHVIKVWAEDDQGGRSADILRTFQVVPNRPASLTIEPIAPISGLIDSDSFTVSGNVSDPDGNAVKVEYKIGGGVYSEIYNGAGGAFSFTVKLADLNAGNNTISIRATDAYGATTVKSLNVAKSGAVKPLKESIVTYRITPPNGTASGVLLWLERDSGDLDVNVEISMTAANVAENWVPMTKNSTAYVDDSVEEDEWTYEADAPYEKVLVRLTLSRTDANSTAGVRLISGVLS